MLEHRKKHYSLIGSDTNHRLFADRVEAVNVDAKLNFRRSIYSQHSQIDRDRPAQSRIYNIRLLNK